MKKYIIIILIGFSLGKAVDISNVQIVAQNIYNEFNTNLLTSKFDVKNIEIIKEQHTDLIYIYHLNPVGFLLIAADDNSSPVVGYGFDNNFSTPQFFIGRWSIRSQNDLKKIKMRSIQYIKMDYLEDHSFLNNALLEVCEKLYLLLILSIQFFVGRNKTDTQRKSSRTNSLCSMRQI